MTPTKPYIVCGTPQQKNGFLYPQSYVRSMFRVIPEMLDYVNKPLWINFFQSTSDFAVENLKGGRLESIDRVLVKGGTTYLLITTSFRFTSEEEEVQLVVSEDGTDIAKAEKKVREALSKTTTVSR